MPEKNDISGAESRVREMDRMARQYLDRTNRIIEQSRGMPAGNTRFEPAKGGNVPAGRQDAPPKPPPLPALAESAPAGQRHNNDILQGLDGEKILIILLIALLLKEKADIKLIAALAYLLI